MILHNLLKIALFHLFSYNQVFFKLQIYKCDRDQLIDNYSMNEMSINGN